VLVGPSSMMDELPGANDAVASNVVSASRLLVCATFSMMIPGFMSLLSCGLLAAFAFLALRFNACNEHKTLDTIYIILTESFLYYNDALYIDLVLVK